MVKHARIASTGTVITAVKYGPGKDGGIVLAADTTSIIGDDEIWNSGHKKIMPLGKGTAIGFAGKLGDAQQIYDILSETLDETKNKLAAEKKESGGKVGKKNADELLESSDILLTLISRAIRPLGKKSDFDLLTLCATFTQYESTIATFDSSAGMAVHEACAAVGSGGLPANVIIKDFFRNRQVKSVKKEEALELTMRALFGASQNNISIRDPRTAPPMIVMIDKDGYRELKNSEIRSAIKKYLP
jgi:20S proteasome alpha/beta subunit